MWSPSASPLKKSTRWKSPARRPAKEIRTSEGDSFTADVVIIATGRKPIPLPVETAFEKVHYCSVCDGTAYKDKDVLVVGGGNSGSTNPCTSRASASVPSISWKCSRLRRRTVHTRPGSGYRHHQANVNTTITALDPLPDGRCRASLRDAASGAASEETVDGVFCFIGQKPNTALFEGSSIWKRAISAPMRTCGPPFPACSRGRRPRQAVPPDHHGYGRRNRRRAGSRTLHPFPPLN